MFFYFLLPSLRSLYFPLVPVQINLKLSIYLLFCISSFKLNFLYFFLFCFHCSSYPLLSKYPISFIFCKFCVILVFSLKKTEKTPPSYTEWPGVMTSKTDTGPNPVSATDQLGGLGRSVALADLCPPL